MKIGNQKGIETWGLRLETCNLKLEILDLGLWTLDLGLVCGESRI
jgi:hypothetical protein